MWFALSILALCMLVLRRSAEKSTSRAIDATTLAWLQQAIALPFIIATLFFARFYFPQELSAGFWQWLAIYVACCAIDLYCYFKALSIADVSYIAPLMSLIAVANIIGAYVVLGQRPSIWGIAGAALIITGAYVVNQAKMKQERTRGNVMALVLILFLVVLRGWYSNIELFMLREVNPTTFNFYSSLLVIPPLLFIASLFYQRRLRQAPKKRAKRVRQESYSDYVRRLVRAQLWPLLFIGLTYTINLTATYQAKLWSPNAGYVGAIKSAQVLPMVLIGALVFREKVTQSQWYGLGFILVGLVLMSFN